MVTLSVRHVPDAVYRALQVRAGDHGRAVEAEILAILEEAVTPPRRTRLGSVLARDPGESGEQDRPESGR
ncbi:FitA-like ribbon-helix-helix domain-containing protein [Nocardia sp. NPDC003345]